LISIGDLKFVILCGTAKFSSEIAKALNFTAEHTEDSGLEV
jgi:hypothetical protein